MDNSNDELMHYGTKRHSGRYPWGSGENPYQHSGDWLSRVRELEKDGKTASEIAEYFKMSATEYKAARSIAANQRKLWEYDTAKKLKAEGKTDAEIAKAIGRPNESSVRSLLKWDPEKGGKLAAQTTADYLRNAVNDLGVIDVGAGVDRRLDVNRERLNQALYILEAEGYEVYGGTMDQVANPGNKFVMRVLAPPGTPSSVVYDPAQIHSILEYDKILTEDGTSIKPAFVYPESFDSARLLINYAETGGKSKDGLIEIRRGVPDLDMGDVNYAQVRVLVDNDKYLKGMAVYSDDLPDGVDIRFNTGKSSDMPTSEVLKKITNDPDNPFGALIKERGGQIFYDDPEGKYVDELTGKRQSLSKINKTREEGDWDKWADGLPSQFLSKQPLKMANQQLELAKEQTMAEYNDILSITNPTLRKDMLYKFADECDSAAEDLQAAAFPRQKYQVILPADSLKENEVYAPNYENGETVALIRYPHGGTFEIPKLVVNNNNKEARKLIGTNASDAVCINSKVAERLSGADFDGDTVQVIPVTSRSNIVSTPPLAGLMNFDPKSEYREREGMKYMKYEVTDSNGHIVTRNNTQSEMGKISNLITDMTILGANEDELARAVRHSMVVIDAAKHKLDYTKSYQDNNIDELKQKYQQRINPETGRVNSGAATLLSRASSEESALKTKGSPKINQKDSKDYDPTKPEGALIYKLDERPKVNRYVNKKNSKYYDPTKPEGAYIYVETDKPRTQQSTKMRETQDARTLISSRNTQMEQVYASYANWQKDMANKARLQSAKVQETVRDPEVAKKYAPVVDKLKKKLKEAASNQDRERYANILANARVKAKKEADPSLQKDKKALGKIRQQELTKARTQVGAKRSRIMFDDDEWEAIQKGGITKTMLKSLFNYADEDALRQRAMPRTSSGLTPSQVALAKTFASRDYTNKDIANYFGVSSSTISKILNGGSD